MKKKMLHVVLAVIMVVTMILPGQNSANAATANLLNTYGSLFGRVGNCVSLSQLQNSSTLNAIKQQYNSVTLENEMKPDYTLGSSANLISVEQAKSLGYYIPSNYTESKVPKINFGTIDKAMQICYENGLGMRAHTLVWHSQTPSWFFRSNFQGGGSFVSKTVMDARLEMFVKTMINHVYSSKYGSCVYAWDIVNEYLHASNSGWASVYGNEGKSPSFVKKAYQYANDALVALGNRDSVSLFFNDYNTYMEADDILAVLKYVNSGSKICDGIGMQAHLDTNFPSAASFKTTIKKFCDAGYEVQITEFDVTNSNASTQANYCYDIMSGVLAVKKAGGNITGFTIWGLYDGISWRSGQSPTLFSSLTQTKASYDKVIKAYTDAGYTVGQTTPTVVPTVRPTATPTTKPTPTPRPSTTPTTKPTVAPTSTPGSGKVTATMKVVNNWGSGGQVEVSIKNSAGSYNSGWTVEFDMNLSGKVSNSWGDGYVSSATNGHVVVKNQSWVQSFNNGSTKTVFIQFDGSAPTSISNVTIK